MLIQLPELNAFKDIPGYKAILKAVIKSQIQFLVEQLSHQTGEESVLLTASISDGTLSHLGSESGKVFLETNDDFRSQFLGFCIKRHHSSVSKATVRKKPPTAKRSVPFGFKNNPKRQHTEVFPTAISKAVLANDEENKGPDAPDISTDLPTNPAVERETLEETLQESSLENKEVASNDDAGSDETIENYPIVKQEPVDESDKSPGFDSSFDISLQNFDTSVTNGEMIVKSKNGKKLGLPSDDQNASFESEPNATVVKREYQDNDIMADEPGSSADDSLNMHEEAQSYNYGHSSGAVDEHQLFFSHAEPTPKKKRLFRPRGSNKPCACEFCGRIIKRGSDMKKHLRIHTGHKPFSCDFCGKRFNQSSALSIHRRIHTGEKPYQCDNCGVSFRRKDALATHHRQCSDDKLIVRIKKERKK